MIYIVRPKPRNLSYTRLGDVTSLLDDQDAELEPGSKVSSNHFSSI